MTLHEAYFFVREKHPRMHPNEGFFSQLKKLAEKERGTKETFSQFDFLVSVLIKEGYDKQLAYRALKTFDKIEHARVALNDKNEDVLFTMEEIEQMSHYNGN
jgi:hypothetical protein